MLKNKRTIFNDSIFADFSANNLEKRKKKRFNEVAELTRAFCSLQSMKTLFCRATKWNVNGRPLDKSVRVVSLSLFAFIIVLQDGRLMCLLIHRYALEAREQCSVFTSFFRRIRTTLGTKHIHFWQQCILNAYADMMHNVLSLICLYVGCL